MLHCLKLEEGFCFLLFCCSCSVYIKQIKSLWAKTEQRNDLLIESLGHPLGREELLLLVPALFLSLCYDGYQILLLTSGRVTEIFLDKTLIKMEIKWTT